MTKKRTMQQARRRTTLYFGAKPQSSHLQKPDTVRTEKPQLATAVNKMFTSN